jgi:hypothetical protein
MKFNISDKVNLDKHERGYKAEIDLATFIFNKNIYGNQHTMFLNFMETHATELLPLLQELIDARKG